MDTDPWRVTPDGLELSARLTPRGGRDQIEGLVEIDGQAALRARVAAPPVGGGANAALVRLLAATAGVAKGRVDIAAARARG